jgi:hypothetical protein
VVADAAVRADIRDLFEGLVPVEVIDAYDRLLASDDLVSGRRMRAVRFPPALPPPSGSWPPAPDSCMALEGGRHGDPMISPETTAGRWFWAASRPAS